FPPRLPSDLLPGELGLHHRVGEPPPVAIAFVLGDPRLLTVDMDGEPRVRVVVLDGGDHDVLPSAVVISPRRAPPRRRPRRRRVPRRVRHRGPLPRSFRRRSLPPP